MELALNKWHIASGTMGCESIIHDITNMLLHENCFGGETINSVVNSWQVPVWWKVFLSILKKHGVRFAYVSNKKNNEKFYAVVDECSVEKMLELSSLYTEFLNKLDVIEENPYFDFVVLGQDELLATYLGDEFRKIE